jgi:phospholipid/cholesterol/gamma-HCH transport system substrate-binding protein
MKGSDMDTKINYTIIGTIGIIFIAIVIGIVVWLSETKKESDYQTYVTYFNQEVTGLSKQSLVRLNGIDIGYVKSISLVKNNMQKVVVKLAIERKIKVTTTSYVILESEGITGNEYIALKAKTPTGEAIKTKPGQKYPTIPSERSLLSNMENQVKDIATNVKILVTRLDDLLNEKNREAIDASLANIKKITTTIANNSDNIDSSLASMQVILKNTKTASKDFPAMIAEARKSLKNFDKVGVKASTTLTSTNAAIKNITSQLLPSSHQLLLQLNNVIRALTQLSRDLAERPSVLIRGKAPGPLGPGEMKNENR